MLIDLPTAKLQASIDDSADDALVTIYIGAAERFAVEYMQRNIYADKTALDIAIAAAPAALSAAVNAYDTAIAAADAMPDGVAKEMATFSAEDAYANAQKAARMTHRGIVLDDNIRVAMLLTIAHLYQNREETVVGVSVAPLPMGAKTFLDLYRAY